MRKDKKNNVEQRTDGAQTALYTLEHQRRVLLANVGTCTVTGDSSCLITFKNKKREALDLIVSEFKSAVRQFDAAERVYVSVPLPPFHGLHSMLMEKKETRSRKGSVVWNTPWYIDQAAYHMKLKNPVQTFLGLKEMTEDVFFHVQRCNMTINDQHFLSTFLAFFTHYEQDFITCAELFHRFENTLDIFRMACPSLVEELESSAKTYFTLLDEVLFVKHTDLISVMAFLFKFLSLLATAIWWYVRLRRDTLHTITERLLHLLQRYNEELRFDNTLINTFYANTKCEFDNHAARLSHFVEILMHHNHEQKYHEIFLLMSHIYTSAETIISHIVPSAVLEESFDRKKQIAAIIKQSMETYPQGFVDIGPAHPLLENHLTNTIDPYKICSLNAQTRVLYQNVRAYTPPLQFMASFDVGRFELTELMIYILNP